MIRSSLRVVGVTVALALPRLAFAEDATAQAKVLFNAGAQAYEAGQFPAAIQAFAEAYRLSPRPGILFSMAQAQRKQYFVDRQPARAREAVRLYREYIAKVEQGGRRGDAAQALSELDPIVEKLGAADATPPPPEKKPATRLSVSASAKDAVVTLDGKPIEVGIFNDVTPQKHTVHVTAPGYFPEDREVAAAEGGITAIDIQMREQPGLLMVTAMDGADVAVDGRVAATTPMTRPIEIPAGTHFIAVTRRGYRPFSEDLDIARGETRPLTVRLDRTGQRIASYALFGLAAAGVATGAVLAGVALYNQGQATTLYNQSSSVGALSSAQGGQYNSYLSARNDFRLASAVAFGTGVTFGLTGVILAVFDVPVVGAGRRRDEGPKPATPGPRDKPVDLAAAPLLGPGFYGASFGARF